MAQYGRPTSDVSTGSWTTAPLYQKVDETPYSDTDYIQLTNATSNSCELGLGSVTDPQVSTGHIVRIRATKVGSGTITLTGYLYEGTTLRATISITLTTSFATTTYTLSAAEADSISNYGNLRVRLTGTAGSTSRYVRVSWIEFEVPSPSYVLQTTIGEFSWTGNDSILRGFFRMLTSTGSFIWTGMDAILTKSGGLTNYLLQTLTGVFNLTGNDARLLKNSKVYTTTGSFSWTRNNAILLKAYKLFTTIGSFSWVRNNAVLLKAFKLFTTTGSFVWTRSNSILSLVRKLLAATGTYVWTGMNAILIRTGGATQYILQTIPGTFSWTRNNGTLLKVYKLFTSVGAFVWTRNNSMLAAGRRLLTNIGTFVWTRWNAILIYVSGQQPGTVEISDFSHFEITLMDTIYGHTVDIIDVAHGTVEIGDTHGQSI